ncbi:MAG: DUF2961 domain-containing protein [Acidimicrobiales bacterium]|nr:DUF2961 domain-containing protein [Acidimicrobiales bacterium]MCB9392274.1 DUF2961 domain-containing protein [Acidimicrobiaceae bacterium]
MFDPMRIDLTQAPRTISFENPTGAAGMGGTVAGGRKGAPFRMIEPGERVTLADIEGPGTVRHVWCTVPPMRPDHLRALVLEVHYDGHDEPSVSVPLPDFFGAVHGRPVPYASALQSTQEGRGYNSWIPMPFRQHLRVELVNASPRPVQLYYQIDLTLGPVPADAGVLHASFRRENPTVLRRDFTIADGFRGPGRFVGCNVGVRVFHEPAWFAWYGEGEVKMYLDGESHPTWCGTGLEDYVGTAYGMGAHQTPYQGAPLVRRDPQAGRPNPDLVSFYRWHLPDPIVFERSLRVTIQQIGAVMVPPGDEHLRDEVDAAGVVAGTGWTHVGGSTVEWFAIAERVDDYCATAFVALEQVQGVVPVDVAAAVADVGRADYERPSAFEVGVTG